MHKQATQVRGGAVPAGPGRGGALGAAAHPAVWIELRSAETAKKMAALDKEEQQSTWDGHLVEDFVWKKPGFNNTVILLLICFGSDLCDRLSALAPVVVTVATGATAL